MAVSGLAVTEAAVGLILVYSGFKGTSLTTTVTDLFKGELDSDTTEGLTSTADATTDSSDTYTGTATDSSSNTAAENQALAKSIIASDSTYSGWDTGTEWSDLVTLWDDESGWISTADNSSSGAYGIAQALPPTKYPAAGQAPPTGTSEPAAQIEWGLSYIKTTYGSPSIALAHENADNWY